MNAKTWEKVYIIAGPEFGPELEGKRLIIDKPLYGLTTSAARFHEHLSAKLRTLGYKPSKADADAGAGTETAASVEIREEEDDEGSLRQVRSRRKHPRFCWSRHASHGDGSYPKDGSSPV